MGTLTVRTANETVTVTYTIPPPPATMAVRARCVASSSSTVASLRADFLNDSQTIGRPLTMTRAFYGGVLPVDQSKRVSPPTAMEVTSYKGQNASSLALFVRSMQPQDRLGFYHEPEGPGDWNTGADFVTAFTSEYHAAHAARSSVKFGMIAGAYQYRTAGRGYDGSFLPDPSVCDFYACDTYRDGSTENAFGAIDPLSQVEEFMRWYNLVKDRGRPLLVTEYGRGTVGSGEVASTPTKRAAVIPADLAWLAAHGFAGISLWYSDFGPDGRKWRFTDQPSINAWHA